MPKNGDSTQNSILGALSAFNARKGARAAQKAKLAPQTPPTSSGTMTKNGFIPTQRTAQPIAGVNPYGK